MDGVILEAQFELKDGSSLICLTDDSPYDEGLHVYLLDQNDAIEDAVEAGADFAAGILRIGQTGDDWMAFEFFSNDRSYRIEVTEKARFRMRLPAGWKYKRRFRNHRLLVREFQKEDK